MMGFCDNTENLYTRFLTLHHMSPKKWRNDFSDISSYFHIVNFSTFNKQELLNSKIVSFAKKYKNCYIILNYSLEGYAYLSFNTIHAFVKEAGLENKVIFLCGNYGTELEYKHWCNNTKTQKEFFVLSFNIFFNTAQDWCNDGNAKFSEAKNKWFCCLNHRPHPHRLASVTYLDYLGLLDQGIVTCHDASYEPGGTLIENNYDTTIQNSHRFWDKAYYDMLMNTYLKTKKKLPLVYDIPDLSDGCQPNNFNPEIYDNCLVNLVTETFCLNILNFESEMFITEKTIKAIITNQIFIIIGPRGILKKLKSMGFKTFSKFFDESYDSMPDSIRPFKAIDTLNDIMKKYTIEELDVLTRDVRAHNLKTLMNSKFNINLMKRLHL